MLLGLFGLQRPPFHGRVEAVTLFLYFCKHFRKSVFDFSIFIKNIHKIEEGLSKHDFSKRIFKNSLQPSPAAAPKIDSLNYSIFIFQRNT